MSEAAAHSMIQALRDRGIRVLVAGQTVVFPDATSAAAGAVYLSDPLKLEHTLTGRPGMTAAMARAVSTILGEMINGAGSCSRGR